MKELKELLGENRIKEILKHPRHKYIDLIYQRVNTERIGTKYKPLSKKIIAIKLAPFSLEDLDYLVKQCSQKSNFSKMFFGMLKIRK